MQRLWLALLLTALVSFLGSLAVTLLTARSYLQQQLEVQSNDSANSLALSMTQQNKDRATVETLINALFDHGHYQRVTFESVTGDVVVDRHSSESAANVPQWFKDLLPLYDSPSVAEVSDGWQQYGNVTVVAHNRYAYESLWRGAGMLLVLMAGVSLLGGWFASLLIRSVRKPLQQVVEQANAVSARQFITVTEPRIPELAHVAHAMNTMVTRVKAMFDEESARLARLRQEANSDPLTQLANRPFFLARLHTSLREEDAPAHGMLLSLKIADLALWNQQLGREKTDQLVVALAHVIHQQVGAFDDAIAGRLSGTEMALLLPSCDATAANQLVRAVQLQWQQLAQQSQVNAANMLASGVQFQRGQESSHLLALIDKYYLPIAQFALHEGDERAGVDWQSVLTEALAEKQFRLIPFPVLDSKNNVLHQELVLRLHLPNRAEPLSAMSFLPHAQRLHLLPQLDLEVLRLGLEWLQQQGGQIALNLSPMLLHDAELREKVRAQLFARPSLAEKLWLEISEAAMTGWSSELVQRLASFASSVRALHVKVGLEHFGRRFEHLPRLHETSLDYLKIDASFVHGIDAHGSNQALIKSIAAIAHGLDMSVIAVGVNTTEEWKALVSVGVDGVTGPAVRN